MIERRQDVSDVSRPGADGRPVVALAREPMRPSAPAGYGMNLRDWLGGEDEPMDADDDTAAWIVQGIVAAGAPGAIAGPPKSLKTFVAESLALHVATGRPWLDRFPTRPGRVLLLPREDTTRETQRRIWRLARGMGIDPRDLADVLRIETLRPFYFDEPADLEAMRLTLGSFRPSLLILDSLARCHRGEENSSTEMRQVTATWADLATSFDTAVVIVHHLRKPPAAGDTQSAGLRMRGTGDLFAVVRHLLAVEPREKGLSLLSTDGNLPGQPDPFALALVDGEDAQGRKTLRLEYRGTPADMETKQVDTLILQALADGPLGARELRRAVGKRNDVVDARCAVLARDGRIVRDGAKEPWRIAGAPVLTGAPSLPGTQLDLDVPEVPADTRAQERANVPRPIGGAQGTPAGGSRSQVPATSSPSTSPINQAAGELPRSPRKESAK